MLNKIKEMTGLKRIVFETLCVMFVPVLTYVITYSITGNIVTSAVVALVAAAVAALAVAVFDAFAVVAVFAAVAFAFVAALAAFAVAFAFAVAVAAAVPAAAVIAREYKVRYHEALIICLIELILLYLSFVYLVPYLSILVLVFTILFACALIGLAYLPESKGRKMSILLEWGRIDQIENQQDRKVIRKIVAAFIASGLEPKDFIGINVFEYRMGENFTGYNLLLPYHHPNQLLTPSIRYEICAPYCVTEPRELYKFLIKEFNIKISKNRYLKAQEIEEFVKTRWMSDVGLEPLETT